MKTKQTLFGITAVALLTVGISQTSHAWFFKTNVDVNASKTYNTSAGRDVGSRNNTNSNNRYGSHDIKGDAKNANFGTINANASNYSGGNSFGSSKSAFGSNRSSLSNLGNNNQGNLNFGSGMNSVQAGSITMGDTHFNGDNAIKTVLGK
ncbi:MAG: hypothetical protein IPJ69_09660 [Deltaproteobacteria bacterium]|nr:MAG: hypothetical protein IPJ69_09660 [Deltaproteobacteria bacterium]